MPQRSGLDSTLLQALAGLTRVWGCRGTPSPRAGRPDFSFGKLGLRCGGQMAWEIGRTGCGAPPPEEGLGARPGAEGLRLEGLFCPRRTLFWVIKNTQGRGAFLSLGLPPARSPASRPDQCCAGTQPRFGDTHTGPRPRSGPGRTGPFRRQNGPTRRRQGGQRRRPDPPLAPGCSGPPRLEVLGRGAGVTLPAVWGCESPAKPPRPPAERPLPRPHPRPGGTCARAGEERPVENTLLISNSPFQV